MSDDTTAFRQYTELVGNFADAMKSFETGKFAELHYSERLITHMPIVLVVCSK